MAAKKKRTKEYRKHALWADGSVPADPYSGLQRCRRCWVMGKPGDSRHTDEHPPTPDGDRSSQIIGEG